jgi:hypothetical protein
LDFINRNKNQFNLRGIKVDLDQNEENKEQDYGFSFIPETPNYGMEDNIFIYKVAHKQSSERNSAKTDDFSFMNNANNLRSPNYATIGISNIRIPTPTINRAIGTFKPTISPTNYGAFGEMPISIQTPVMSYNQPPNIFQKQRNSNPRQSLSKLFGKKEPNLNQGRFNIENDSNSNKVSVTCSLTINGCYRIVL